VSYSVCVNGRRLEDLSPRERRALDRRARSRLADMIRSGRPPRAVTDDTFRAGLDDCNGRQFEGDPETGDFYRQAAAAAGVSTRGKTYLHGLAAFPGDPRAWVDSRGDVARVCEERNYHCDGAVTHKAREVEPVEVGLAADIVEREAAEIVAADPGVRPDDAREQVRAKRTPHWAKK
jgi:hypothetical protein